MPGEMKSLVLEQNPPIGHVLFFASFSSLSFFTALGSLSFLPFRTASTLMELATKLYKSTGRGIALNAKLPMWATLPATLRPRKEASLLSLAAVQALLLSSLKPVSTQSFRIEEQKKKPRPDFNSFSILLFCASVQNSFKNFSIASVASRSSLMIFWAVVTVSHFLNGSLWDHGVMALTIKGKLAKGIKKNVEYTSLYHL